MIETVYVARHGFRLSWVMTNWKSPTGTARDPPISAYGEAQAQELTNHFLSMPQGDQPDVIYSSPYSRCLQTAKPISEALNLPIYVEHGLSEWYNHVKPNTGLLPRPQAAAALRTHFPAIDPSHESFYVPSRRGESVEEMHQRTAIVLQALIKKGKGSRILLVTHAATAIGFVRSLLNERELPLRVGCCSLSTLHHEPDGTWCAIGGLSDASFLRNGVERDWGFEDVQFEHGEVVEDVGEGERDEGEDWRAVDRTQKETHTLASRM